MKIEDNAVPAVFGAIFLPTNLHLRGQRTFLVLQGPNPGPVAKQASTGELHFL